MVFLLVAVFFVWYVKSRYKLVYLLFSDVLLLVFGAFLVQNHNLQWKQSYYGNYIDESKTVRLIAVVESVPSEKAKTFKVQLGILEVEQNGTRHAVQGNCIAYFKKHIGFKRVKAGALLSLQTRFVKVEPPFNPGEFDYKTYLSNRQIYHLAFLDSANYRLLPAIHTNRGLKGMALSSKQWILERLKSAGLTQQSYAICSALLTGFDEEIGQDVLKAFAHSGTLHVLSVSGLHTGLIFIFLSGIFDLFDRQKKWKKLKFAVLMAVLWSFALLTGLEAPVLRSVVMLSLFSVGSVFYHNEPKSQLNILFVSAFLLLCVNPYFITEVGFQLSFAAIFGLIVFEPAFSGLWQTENSGLVWIWKSISASFAATLSTLPFTLLYFKQFPFWFFIANLVVVPASFLLLLLAVPVLFHFKWLVMGVNWIVDWLIQFISLFNSGTWTYLDGIHFETQDAFWLTTLIALTALAFYRRSFLHLRLSIWLLVIWQLSAFFRDMLTLNTTLVAVYAVNKTPMFAVKDGGRLFYSASDPGHVDRYLKPHVTALGNPKLIECHFNCVQTQHSQFLFFNGKGCMPLGEQQLPTYLILSGDHVLGENELRYYSDIKVVVMDQTLRQKNREGVEKLCRKFGLLCYDTRKQGAFIFSQDEIENWR